MAIKEEIKQMGKEVNFLASLVIFLIIGFLTSLVWTSYLLQDIQEEIDSMPHYDCGDETIKKEFMSFTEIDRRGYSINSSIFDFFDVYCDYNKEMCYRNSTEEVCEIVRNSKQGGKA